MLFCLLHLGREGRREGGMNVMLMSQRSFPPSFDPSFAYQTFSNISGKIFSSPFRTTSKACSAMPSILTNHWEET